MTTFKEFLVEQENLFYVIENLKMISSINYFQKENLEEKIKLAEKQINRTTNFLQKYNLYYGLDEIIPNEDILYESIRLENDLLFEFESESKKKLLNEGYILIFNGELLDEIKGRKGNKINQNPKFKQPLPIYEKTLHNLKRIYDFFNSNESISELKTEVLDYVNLLEKILQTPIKQDPKILEKISIYENGCIEEVESFGFVLIKKDEKIMKIVPKEKKKEKGLNLGYEICDLKEYSKLVEKAEEIYTNPLENHEKAKRAEIFINNFNEFRKTFDLYLSTFDKEFNFIQKGKFSKFDLVSQERKWHLEKLKNLKQKIILYGSEYQTKEFNGKS